MASKTKSAPKGLSEADLSRVGEALRGALYRNVYDFVAHVQAEVVDGLRFAPLASELSEARARRRLDLKGAAKLLKKPQYVVRQIESGQISEVGLGVIERYAEALGVKGLLDRWKLQNPELVLRLGRPMGESPMLTPIEQQVLGQFLRSTQDPAPALGPALATSPGSGPSRALQLRIVLETTEPAIWRSVLVTDDTTLAGLHNVIQETMGWLDSHLYCFEIKGRRYVDSELMDDPDPDDYEARRTRLSDMSLEPSDSFTYEYDFGDGWEHRITVERIVKVEPHVAYPTCLAGARACPPEDSGGPHGYQELLDILADPAHPEHDDRESWVGGNFDPEVFDLAGVNETLGRKRRRGRK